MKTRNILISLLSIAFLVGCARGTSSESQKSEESKPAESSQQPSSQTPSSSSEAPSSQVSSESEQSSEPAESSEPEEEHDSNFVIEDFGTTRFEAEWFDINAWFEDDSYDSTIVEDEKASGGKYLAAPLPESGSQALFSFTIKEKSKVTLYVAYAQKEADKNQDINMANVYSFSVESVQGFTTSKALLKRDSASAWSPIEYSTQELYAGTYSVTLDLLDNAARCPSIDYIEFKTSDASYVPEDPSDLIEADIPDNDMRNLQQYKYLMDEEFVKNYKSYGATNSVDYSAPRGMKLRFNDVETASTYYVQIAESEAGLANAPVRTTTENKVYTFHNAKLATKYYYRAATSEAGLANAAVKDITSTAMAPRVVYVPDVLNFRDIGGWDTDLVPGAKINQGLYFRCAQLNGAAGSTTSKLDSAGKGLAALKELGIKCDIDMRDSYNQPSNGVSPANTADWPISFVSAAVPSSSEPVRWEGGTYSNTNIAQQYVKIFNAIAKCDEEPVMLHCTYGADRTGIATFFLEALLGMSEEDMTKDYLFTQFTKGRDVKIKESDGAEFPQWISKTWACEGTSFADKMKNHLMSFGIEEETLEHIREIFIPGYVAQA